MDTDDKRDDETWAAYWQRKHDERHGPACDTPGCVYRRGPERGRRELLPEELRLPEQVPEAKRIDRRRIMSEQIVYGPSSVRAMVKDRLGELADGCAFADDVAAKLRKANCKGDKEACETCPVAMWLELGLRPKLGQTWMAVRVFPSEVEMWRPDADEAEVVVALPDVLADFIECMDNGRYPDLVRQQ